LSAREPFAGVCKETSVPGAEGFSVIVCRTELCPPWSNWNDEASYALAKRINAAVERERRQAAAKALRDAADERAGDAGDDAVCRWLRSRAAALDDLTRNSTAESGRPKGSNTEKSP
jgi:hypothetical protein